MKRWIAFLLALSVVFSLVACGAPGKQETENLSLQVENTDEMDREDKELVAELIGGTDASDMTDAELDALVDQLKAIGSQSLTLKHESGSRAMLADGAVAAARFMEGKANGLYNMEDILNQNT